jgi:hypothetical protein
MIEGWWRPARPWLILAAVAGLAAWHTLDFSEAPTGFPGSSARPSTGAPGRLRLAEPGDTLDRIGLYLASGATAIALGAWLRGSVGDRPRLWPSALALGLAATWHASTRAGLRRLARASGGAWSSTRPRRRRSGSPWAWRPRHWWGRSRRTCSRPEARISLRPPALVVAAGVFVCSTVRSPGVEPVGYWPRVAFDLGVLAFGIGLVQARR